MKFPAYVPDAVQEHITRLVDGDGHGFKGWAAATNEPGNQWISSVVDFLRRFEQEDERISGMFRYLDDAGLNEQEQKKFVEAAWLALNDYEEYRDLTKRAEEQRKAITEKATELAGLLRGLAGHGVISVPLEFYNVRALLRNTDGSDRLWPLMREKLLVPTQDGREFGDLAYVWGIAPVLADVLDTVAKTARDYQPEITGRIGAAISKDQRSPRTEYIRAFGCTLLKAGIPLTKGSVSQSMAAKAPSRRKSTPEQTVAYRVRKAMAALATVALDETIVEREIAQQFPDKKPLTRLQQHARVIRFD